MIIAGLDLGVHLGSAFCCLVATVVKWELSDVKSAGTHLNSVYVKPMLYNSILKQNGSDFFLFSFFFCACDICILLHRKTKSGYGANF